MQFYLLTQKGGNTDMGSLVNILWTVAVVLIALWVIGFMLGWVATSLGWLLHLLLVVAVVVILYNLLTRRRSV
jgi:ABC-type iron transport system FetAB permease component